MTEDISITTAVVSSHMTDSTSGTQLDNEPLVQEDTRPGDYSRFYVYKSRTQFDGANFIAFDNSSQNVDIELAKRKMSPLGEMPFGSGTVATFVTPTVGFAKYKKTTIKQLKPNLKKVKKKKNKIKKSKSK